MPDTRELIRSLEALDDLGHPARVQRLTAILSDLEPGLDPCLLPALLGVVERSGASRAPILDSLMARVKALPRSVREPALRDSVRHLPHWRVVELLGDSNEDLSTLRDVLCETLDAETEEMLIDAIEERAGTDG